MPNKLKILLVLMSLFALETLYKLGTSPDGRTVNTIVLVIRVLMILGVFRGSDSVRKILYFFASLGAVLAAFGVIGSLAVFSLTGLLVSAGHLGINLFYISCLGDEAVKGWMFRRQIGEVASGPV